MRQVCFCLADVARATYFCRSHALRDGPFHASPLRIFRLVLLGLLALAASKQCFVLRLRAYGDGAAWGSCLRTLFYRWADLAVGHRERDRDDVVLAFVYRWRPTVAMLAHWAYSVLLFPVDGNVSGGEPRFIFCLPVVIASGWADTLDIVRGCAAHQQDCVHLPGVGNVLFRQQLHFSQRGVNGFGDCIV